MRGGVNLNDLSQYLSQQERIKQLEDELTKVKAENVELKLDKLRSDFTRGLKDETRQKKE